jgi:predicted protein tyrosine phosphatase
MDASSAAPAPISLLTICGLEELGSHGARGVTHVLSILDPDTPEPAAFGAYGEIRRTTLRFHDVIEPGPNATLPSEADVDAILAFARDVLAEERAGAAHVLVHCHVGISRSTAAMLMLIALAYPDEDEEAWVARLHAMRAKAWPNARMVAFADARLGRGGRLSEAVRRLHGRQLLAYPNVESFLRANGRSAEVDAAQRG